MIILGLGGLFVINHFNQNTEPAVVCCKTNTNAKTNAKIPQKIKVAK